MKVTLADIEFEWECRNGKVRRALTSEYMIELYNYGARKWNKWVKKRRAGQEEARLQQFIKGLANANAVKKCGGRRTKNL